MIKLKELIPINCMSKEGFAKPSGNYFKTMKNNFGFVRYNPPYMEFFIAVS
jgi:hypothetical protein